MYPILIAWILSLVFCGLFTFILPAIDSAARRRPAQVHPATSPRRSSRSIASPAQ